MKKRGKSSLPKVDPYLEAMMSKLLDRLVSVEKKLDAALAQARSGTGQALRPQPIQVVPQPRRDRVMYEAICADCSKVCEVPFKPTEERPVYCKDCWAKRKGGGQTRSATGMPVLRPVALPPKPVSKLSAAAQALSAARPAASAKAKKVKPAKKSKKKK